MIASNILTHPCLRYRIRPIPRDCFKIASLSDVMVSCLPAPAPHGVAPGRPETMSPQNSDSPAALLESLDRHLDASG